MSYPAGLRYGLVARQDVMEGTRIVDTALRDDNTTPAIDYPRVTLTLLLDRFIEERKIVNLLCLRWFLQAHVTLIQFKLQFH